MRDLIDLKDRKTVDTLLDYILNFLKDTTSEKPSDLLTDLFHPGPNGLDLQNRDRKILFHKLLKDGYIGQLEHIEKTNDYVGVYITLEGLIFIIDGGYLKQTMIARSKDRRKKYVDSLLVIASILGVVYTIIQIFEFIYKFSHCCICS